MSDYDPKGQPPEVDIHDDDKMYPPVDAAAQRIIDFVSWFGDGEVGGFETGPPLYARDLVAVVLEVQKEKPCPS